MLCEQFKDAQLDYSGCASNAGKTQWTSSIRKQQRTQCLQVLSDFQPCNPFYFGPYGARNVSIYLYGLALPQLYNVCCIMPLKPPV